MNSLANAEELVFKSLEDLGGFGYVKNCYLLEVSNTTVSPNYEKGPVTLVTSSCLGEKATDLALCMKCKGFLS